MIVNDLANCLRIFFSMAVLFRLWSRMLLCHCVVSLHGQPDEESILISMV